MDLQHIFNATPTIGIDVSINSTGIAILNPNADPLFIQIIPHAATITGKGNRRNLKISKDIMLQTYNRIYHDNATSGNNKCQDSYTTEDINKIISADNLAHHISNLITAHSKAYRIQSYDIRQEGSIMTTSFKSKQSRLNDLTLFNVTIKRMLLQHPLVSKITFIAPSALKKSYTGKGNAKKTDMIHKFLQQFPTFDNTGKIDDVVDAYALATA